MTRVRKICPEIFCRYKKSVHIFNSARDENLFLKMAREKKRMATPVLFYYKIEPCFRLFSCLVYWNHYLPFCRTFLHMVDKSPGKCSLGFSCLQSVIGNEVLSNGSAHLGSPSERQTQHFIDSPIMKIVIYYISSSSLRLLSLYRRFESRSVHSRDWNCLLIQVGPYKIENELFWSFLSI